MESELPEVIRLQRQILAIATCGFCDPPYSKLVYIARGEQGCCWYTLTENNSNGQQQPILERALKGIVRGIRLIEKRSDDFDDTVKAYIYVVAGNTRYILRVGYETAFFRGFLTAFTTLVPEEVVLPIWIGVKPGDHRGQKTVLCELWHPVTEQKIFVEPEGKWKDLPDAHWQRLCDSAITMLEHVHGPLPKRQQQQDDGESAAPSGSLVQSNGSTGAIADQFKVRLRRANSLETLWELWRWMHQEPNYGALQEVPATYGWAMQQIQSAERRLVNDVSDLIARSDVHIARLGWTNEQGKKHLNLMYHKQSRSHLSPIELFDFVKTLEATNT